MINLGKWGTTVLPPGVPIIGNTYYKVCSRPGKIVSIESERGFCTIYFENYDHTETVEVLIVINRYRMSEDHQCKSIVVKKFPKLVISRFLKIFRAEFEKMKKKKHKKIQDKKSKFEV